MLTPVQTQARANVVLKRKFTTEEAGERFTVYDSQVWWKDLWSAAGYHQGEFL